MELVTILATVILLATLITLFFSFAAYFITRAKKLRSGGGDRPSSESGEGGEGGSVRLTPAQRGRELFERYTPGQSESKWQAPTSSASNEPAEEDDQWM